jgi:hypothetical protein
MSEFLCANYAMVRLDFKEWRRLPLWWRLFCLAKLPYDVARLGLFGTADFFWAPRWVFESRKPIEYVPIRKDPPWV